MKKIFVIAICAALIASALACSVFAADVSVPDEAWKLGDFGQKHFTVEKVKDTVPEIDGKVGSKEYAERIYDMVPLDDWSDGRFFALDDCTSIDGASIYLSHDDNYIYFAAEIADASICANDAVKIFIGCKENNISYNVSLPVSYSNGNPTFATRYIEECVTSAENGVITYEMKFKRNALATYAGIDSLDKMYLRVVFDVRNAQNPNSTVGELWFGFDVANNSPMLQKYSASRNRFPHVIFFDETIYVAKDIEVVPPADKVEAPGTDAPVTEPPVTEPVTEKKGCGASLSLVGVGAILSLTAIFFLKKRED